jgi:hypothetical protein
VELLGMRRLPPIDPHALVKTDGIDYERIAFPMTNGVPVIAGREVLGMLSSIRVNNAKRMGTADIHDENALEVGHIKDFHAVRSEKLTRTA